MMRRALPVLFLVPFLGCSGWPTLSPPNTENLKGSAVELGIIGLLPPENTTPRPLADERSLFSLPSAMDDPFESANAWVRIVADAIEGEGIRALAEGLAREGIPTKILTRQDILEFVLDARPSTPERSEDEWVDRDYSYGRLASAQGVATLARIRYSASRRKGSGSDRWLFGALDVDYPAGTKWYTVQMNAEILDAESGEARVRASRGATNHTTLATMAGRSGNADMLRTLVRSVGRRLARDIAQAARSAAPSLPDSPETSSPPRAVPDGQP